MVMTFNPDDPHDGHAAADGGFTYRMVHIWPEFLASLTGTPLPLFRAPVIEDAALAAALRRLHLALTGPASELARYERLTGTARLLVRHAPGRSPLSRGGVLEDGSPRGRPDYRVAARIRELIHETPADLTADDLAAAAGCSRFAAYRAFSAAYGLAPSDYQRQLRIRVARGLLRDGVSPARAAAEAGFADQAHLTRWFRRYYGVTPGAYRAAVRDVSLLVGGLGVPPHGGSEKGGEVWYGSRQLFPDGGCRTRPPSYRPRMASPLACGRRLAGT
jgi:AraC-like DNA-binding protein